MQKLYFKVADLTFKVVLPAHWNFAQLLPAFDEFYSDEVSCEDILFTACFNVQDLPACGEDRAVISTSDNDMGHMTIWNNTLHYGGDISYGDGQKKHEWCSDRLFQGVHAQVDETDASLALAVTSILRLTFSQSILRMGGISIHASCIMLNNEGFLFLGKSGTGKSTHARMWLQSFAQAELLNDDNPALRIVDGKCYVYGTPWSGKTPCYKQKKLPVKSIVRLEQAPLNTFKQLDEIEAFSAILPSCSVIRNDENLQDLLYDTLVEITSLVEVGWMKCLPNTEAAKMCSESIQNASVE